MSDWLTVYVPVGSAVVTTVTTVILARLTAKYVKLTSDLVTETRRSRLPAVCLDFETPDQIIRMTIANQGQSTARTIRLEVLRDADWLAIDEGKPGLRSLDVFKTGISQLTPGRTLKYFASYHHLHDLPVNDPGVSVAVSYEDDAGVSYRHVVDFNFSHLKGVLESSFIDPSESVARAIRQVEISRRLSSRAYCFENRFFASPTKKCPSCGEQVLKIAKKCKHCHEVIPEDNSNDQKQGTP